MKRILCLEDEERELDKLEHRLHRYWKKLLAVAIGVAKEKGIKTRIISFGDVITDSSEIHVYEDGDYIYADQLLELARDKAPSLYRRYKEGKAKYERERK